MGNMLVPVFKSDQSTYRSEIGGLYGLVMVVEDDVSFVCRVEVGFD